MLAGEDLRSLPEERRLMLYGRFMPKLADTIRYSETFEVSATELIDSCFCGSHGAFVILEIHPKTTAARMALRFKARRSKHGNKGFVGPEAQRS